MTVRTVAVLGATAAAGAGAALIGGAVASPPHHRATGPAAHRPAPPARLRRAVHVTAVVPRPGGGFATATIDRGVITKVAGSTLTLRQGTRRSTWRTTTVTVPASARVVIDHRAGRLTGVRPGQIAVVARLPRRTVVRVHDRR